jgi:hypothetical protein
VEAFDLMVGPHAVDPQAATESWNYLDGFFGVVCASLQIGDSRHCQHFTNSGRGIVETTTTMWEQAEYVGVLSDEVLNR